MKRRDFVKAITVGSIASGGLASHSKAEVTETAAQTQTDVKEEKKWE